MPPSCRCKPSFGLCSLRPSELTPNAQEHRRLISCLSPSQRPGATSCVAHVRVPSTSGLVLLCASRHSLLQRLPDLVLRKVSLPPGISSVSTLHNSPLLIQVLSIFGFSSQLTFVSVARWADEVNVCSLIIQPTQTSERSLVFAGLFSLYSREIPRPEICHSVERKIRGRGSRKTFDCFFNTSGGF